MKNLFFISLLFLHAFVSGQSLVSISPSRAESYTSLDVVLTGTNTNFELGSNTLVTFTPSHGGLNTSPLVVEYTEVLSPTELRVSIFIPQTATIGKYDVLIQGGSTDLQLKERFSVDAPPAVLQSISPSSSESNTSLDVVLTGTNTNFELGSNTLVTFTPSNGGVNTSPLVVEYTEVLSPTELRVIIFIPQTATIGKYDVLIQGGSSDLQLKQRFSVVAPPAVLQSISPSSAESNTSLDVVLTGTNTNFVLGSNTLVTFTPYNGGVNTSPLVVEYTEVLSPTELRVSIFIPQTATIGKYDVLIQGGSTDLHLKERFIVVAPPAVLQTISPSSVESNTSLDVVLTGTNTNFVLGSNTLVTFTPSNGGVNTSPLVVEYTEVLSPTELRVSIFIPQTATIGKYDVLIQGGSTDLQLKERFSVVSPPAVLQSISPSSAESNTSLDVLLTGTNTNFVLGSNTLVTFTPYNGGVNTSPLVVEYTEVLSPTELRVSIFIPQTATIGKYDVLIQGGSTDLHLKERFIVVAPPAVLQTISPSSVESNTSLDVVLTGTNTNFVLGSNTLVTFTPSNGGVNTSPLVVEYTEVLSPTELRVSIFIPQTATIGKYDVLIQGGSTDLQLKERFSVVSPPAVLQSISPSSAESNTSLDVVLTGTNTNFVLGSNTLVTFTPSNGGVNTSPLVVEYTEVLSPTELRVSIFIPQTATIGKYDVLIQGGSTDLQLKERFSVDAPPAVLQSISPSSSESNTSLDVVLTGTNTNFVLGSNTLVTFTPSNGVVNTSPLVVEYTEVLSPTQLKVSLAIPANLCQDTFSVQIAYGQAQLQLKDAFIVTKNKAQFIITSDKTIICQGDKQTLKITNSQLGAVTWYFNGGIMAGQHSDFIEVGESGQYMATNGYSSCVDSSNIVEINTVSLPTIPQIQPLCLGESRLLSVLNEPGKWRVENTTLATISDSGLLTGLATGISNVLYELETTHVCSAKVIKTPLTILKNTDVQIISSSDGFLCPGKNLQLTANAAGKVQWNTGDTSHVINVDKVGTYTVNSLDGICTGSAQFTVKIDTNTIEWSIPTSISLQSGDIQLQAKPVGGVFEGYGISGNTFSPVKAGLGVKKITYRLSDNNRCSKELVKSVLIFDTLGVICSKYDTITVTNNVTKYDTVLVNKTVFDTVTTNVNKYDTITITNNVTKYDTVLVNKTVFDTVTVTTNVNKYDTITVTNNVTKYDTVLVNKTVFDTVTVTNNINKYDTITVTNNVTKYDTVLVNKTVFDTVTTNVNKYDTITVTNNVTKYDTVLVNKTVFDTVTVTTNVNKYDTITVTNNVTKYDTVLVNKTVFDTVTVTTNVNKYDTITVTNNVTKYDTVLVNKTVFDTVTVTNNINKYDTITVTNNVTKYDTVLVNKTVFDTVTVTNNINKYDTITVTNNVTKYDTVLVNKTVFDTVTVTTNVNKYDTITVTNNVTKYDTVIVPKTVTKYDTITVTKNVTKYDTVLVNKTVFDTVTVTTNVNKYDTITVTNNVTKYDTVLVNKTVFDTVTVTTNVNKYDTITVTNNVTKYDTVIVPKTVTKYDTITVTKNVTKYDTVLVNKTVFDTVTITNNVTKYDTLKVTKFDTITIKNNVYDTVTITNNVTKYDTILVNKYDTITVTNNVTKYDTITLTDTVSILKITFKLTTGNQANQMASMSLYPNPTTDVLHIEVGDAKALDGYRYRILDALGKEVYNELVKNAITEIPLKTLGAAGMYQFEVLDQKNVRIQTNKIVLQ